jgi:methionyl-tRNA synthetase
MESCEIKSTLITTAISYTNGDPHIGHLYESILGDFLKKTFELLGDKVKLLTGTDEHGKKIETTAQTQNITPKELCDINSLKFKKLNNDVHVDYDYFIRTTDEEHKELVQESIKKAYNNNDIYLDTYTGYYSVREECNIPTSKAEKSNYLDEVTGKPYEIIKEESYYFKLSKYKDYIQQLIADGLLYSPEILNASSSDRLEELENLSISRTSFDWGIIFPKLLLDDKLITENKHIVYVWFDALLNYVTGNKKLFGDSDKTKLVHNIVHLIGRDIVWFHAVIYPAILKSCNYLNYIPSKILVHGFILDKNGFKMSKSLNNIIHVDYLLNKYPIDAIRYYFIMSTKWGDDIEFNETALVDLYNNVLIKDFGNLYQRLYNVCKPFQNKINEHYIEFQDKYIELENNFNTEISTYINEYNINNYKTKINYLYQYCNKEITINKPWDKTIEEPIRIKFMCEMLIHLKFILKLLYPIIPNKIKELNTYIVWNNNVVTFTQDKIKVFEILK